MEYEDGYEMEVEDDTLIITDPCYLIREKDWDKWIKLRYDSPSKTKLDDFLRDKLGFGDVIAADTGVGDWNNELYNIDTKETVGRFTADAGMVMVCTASDLTNYGYDKQEFERLQKAGCIAVIPNYTGLVALDYIVVDKNYKTALLMFTSETCGDFRTLEYRN